MRADDGGPHEGEGPGEGRQGPALRPRGSGGGQEIPALQMFFMRSIPPAPVYIENRLYNHVQGPPEDVEYVGSQDIEERHAQKDQLVSSINLMVFWLINAFKINRLD